MSRKSLVLAVAFTVVAAVVSWQWSSGQAPAPVPGRVKWEYMVAALAEKQLNKAGDEGWEVVGMANQITSRPGGNRGNTYTDVSSQIKVLLKRSK
jgi:hypothetical protein